MGRIPSVIYDPTLRLYLPLHKVDGARFMSHDAFGHLCVANAISRRDQGMYFDGLTSWLRVGPLSTATPLALQFVNQEFTLNAWIQPDASYSNNDTDGGIIDHYITANNKGYYMEWESNNGGRMEVDFGIGNAVDAFQSPGTIKTDLELRIGQFMFISCRLARNNAAWEQNIFVDGDRDRVRSAYGTDDDATAEFLIGSGSSAAGPGSEYFKGIIGEVHVYGRALTAQEILQIYIATKDKYR